MSMLIKVLAPPPGFALLGLVVAGFLARLTVPQSESGVHCGLPFVGPAVAFALFGFAVGLVVAVVNMDKMARGRLRDR